MTTGEGTNEDRPVNEERRLRIGAESHHCRRRTDPTVHLQLHSSLTRKQDLLHLEHLADAQDHYAGGSDFTSMTVINFSVHAEHAEPLSAVSTGIRERDGRALAGERVRLPADQPEAVRPASGADRLGGTPGLLPLRPLPDRQ